MYVKLYTVAPASLAVLFELVSCPIQYTYSQSWEAAPVNNQPDLALQSTGSGFCGPKPVPDKRPLAIKGVKPGINLVILSVLARSLI